MLMSRNWRIALSGIVALVSQSNARPIIAQADTGVPGCYHVTLGPWSIESRLGPDRPTSIIRLDTIPRKPGASGDLAAERIEPAVFAATGDPRLKWQRSAYWRREARDSVVIVAWSTGTEAEVFYGHWAGGSLSGVLRRTSDAIPVDPLTKEIQWNVWPWASAHLKRVSCPES